MWTSFTFVATEVVQVDRVHYAMLAALFFNGRHAMGRLLAWLYNAERLDAGKASYIQPFVSTSAERTAVQILSLVKLSVNNRSLGTGPARKYPLQKIQLASSRCFPIKVAGAKVPSS